MASNSGLSDVGAAQGQTRPRRILGPTLSDEAPPPSRARVASGYPEPSGAPADVASEVGTASQASTTVT